MHHADMLKTWSRGDQAFVEVPVMIMTGFWSPLSWCVGLGPHTCGQNHQIKSKNIKRYIFEKSFFGLI